MKMMCVNVAGEWMGTGRSGLSESSRVQGFSDVVEIVA